MKIRVLAPLVGAFLCLLLSPLHNACPTDSSMAAVAIGCLAEAQAAGGTCGDGNVDMGEDCDDGNTTSGDGCSSGCRTETLQSKEQWKCIAAINKFGGKVAKAQGTVNRKTVSDAGKGKVADPQAELTADTKGKISKATQKTLDAETKFCGVLPDFGYVGGSAVNGYALEQELGLVADLFGLDLNATMLDASVDPDGAACQAAVAKAVEKLMDVHFKEFGKCKKKGLAKEQILSTTDLGACFDQLAADEKEKLQKKRDKIQDALDKKCASVALDSAVAGDCGLAPDPALCLGELVACRACSALVDMDDLDVDCDVFDNGADDDSCCAQADRDCLGECFGPAVEDCEGTCEGPAVLDCEGTCNGSAVVDCNGTCNGGLVLDCNGVCGGTAAQDCEGVCEGAAVQDCAGICNGSTPTDCAGLCDGSTPIDCAGICAGTTVPDCTGTCGGPAAVDSCGVCDGGDERIAMYGECCSPAGPCSEGMGTCSGNADCESGLACLAGGGALYGPDYPTDVCVPDCWQPEGDGLVADYESSPGSLFVSRVDPFIANDWVFGAPLIGMPVDGFQIRWTGALRPPVSGSYDLRIVGRGAITFTFDGGLIGSWSGSVDETTTVVLEGNRLYAIDLLVTDTGGTSSIEFQWQQPGAASPVVVPRSALFSGQALCECFPGFTCSQDCTIGEPCHVGQGNCETDAECVDSAVCGTDNGTDFGLAANQDICTDSCAGSDGTGLWGEYYENGTMDAPGTLLESRLDSQVLFNWGFTEPAAGVPVDGFVVRWQGLLRPPADEDLRLCMETSSDEAEVYFGGRLVAQGDGACSLPFPVLGNRPYPIEIRYRDPSGVASVSLQWQTPTIAKQAIPTAYLFPPEGTATQCLAPASPAHCANGFRDPQEIGVDCGGACAACSYCGEDDECSIDCPCEEGRICTSDVECDSRLLCGQDNGGAWGQPAAADVCENLCPQATGDGLYGRYYNPNGVWDLPTYETIHTAPPYFARVDPTVDYNWVFAAPVAGMDTDGFYALWEGEVVAAENGDHDFCVVGGTNDQVELRLNGILVLAGQGCTGAISMVSGERRTIRLDYRDPSGGASVSLQWQPPSEGSAVTIPSSQLYSGKAACECESGGDCYLECSPDEPCLVGQGSCTSNADCGADALCGIDNGADFGFAADQDVCYDPCNGQVGTGLWGEYFSDGTAEDPGTPFASQLDPVVDFSWAFGSALAGLPADGFVVRWTGTLRTPNTEPVRLCLPTSSDQAYLRLNGEVVAIGDGACSVPINAVGGRRYDLEIGYRDPSGVATVSLQWQSPTFSQRPVPQGHLFPSPSVATACSPLAPPAHCSNGFVDAAELDVDCGGLCASCTTCPEAGPCTADCPCPIGGSCTMDEQCEGRLLCDGGTCEDTCAQPSGDGLLGRYFSSGGVWAVTGEGVERTGSPAFVRVDPTISYAWGFGAPVSGVTTDGFYTTWSGQVEAAETGDHTFCVTTSSGDQAWLLLDDVLLLSSPGCTGLVSLTAGERPDIRLDYRDPSTSASVTLQWQPPSEGAPVTIPESQLYSLTASCECAAAGTCPLTCTPTDACLVGQGNCGVDGDCEGGALCGTDNGADFGYSATEDVCYDPCVGVGAGLWGEYYSDGTHLAPGTLFTSQQDAQVNVNWGFGAPHGGMPTDGFVVRWRGAIRPPTSEPMRLKLFTSSDQAYVLFDGNVIAYGDDVYSVDLDVVGGRRYPLEIGYRDPSGSASAHLYWESLSITEEVVPQDNLFPPPGLGTACQ